MHEGKDKILHVIDTSGGGSGMASYGSGVFLGYHIVLTEHRSQKILKYNEDGDLLNQLQLRLNPYDIIKSEDTKVGVACKQIIYIVDVQNMAMQLSIPVSTSFRGIQYTNGFITAFSDTLSWIDSSSV